ncbi:MAG: hypothetical protein GY809_23505, partial [Planctomycetes bacterium]|nr:hypothetical protein [Planctomycetota bacterium]
MTFTKGELVASLKTTVKDVQELTPRQSVEMEMNRTATLERMPEVMRDMYNDSKKELNSKQRARLRKILMNRREAFSLEGELGEVDVVRHKIDTGDCQGVRDACRRHPLNKVQEIEDHVEEQEKLGVVTDTQSDWAANPVMVNKKTGDRRFCVDYRRLNEKTVPDAYPLPRIDETLDHLRGAVYFCVMDAQSGFWQILIDEKDQDKTAFYSRNGLKKYTRMPFGLRNAPATFQRAMEVILRGLQWKLCMVYVDDVIVFGRTIEETMDRMEVVLDRLIQHGMKLKPKKCQLFKKEIHYLGHVISGAGVSMDEAKCKEIDDWPVPKCRTELRSFLGLCCYYRSYVPKYAKIAKTMNRLLEDAVDYIWGKYQQEAFERLKSYLSGTSLLAYADPNKPYILDTDASGYAVGAVLSQLDEQGRERVVEYYSKTLSKEETRYCVTRKELLAVILSLKHFRPYLYAANTTVRTDHAALKW